MSLTELSAHSLLPGAWVDHAQAALDSLSELTTIDEVAEHFGSARQLVLAVLGSPAAGGHATKPVVRAVGQLLHHQLSPAVAAEALSWAAAVADAVDTTTIEALLRTAADSAVALRPIRLADRHLLADCVSQQRTPTARRAALLDIWRTHRADALCSLHQQFDARESRLSTRPPSQHGCGVGHYYWDPNTDDEVDVAAWLASLNDPDPSASTRYVQTPGTRLRARLESAASADQRRAILVDASSEAIRQLLNHDDLLDLAVDAIEYLLLEFTRQMLASPACPSRLHEVLTAPYDLATLELTLRAGMAHYCRGRIRSMLERLDPATRERFAATIPVEYIVGLRVAGLLSVDMLVNELADIDLTNSRNCEAALPQHRFQLPEFLPDLVDAFTSGRPECRRLIPLVEYIRPRELTAGHLDRLAVDGFPDVQRVAVRWIAESSTNSSARVDLAARHAPAALLAGGAVVASCPGIPAARRPAAPLGWLAERRWSETRSAGRFVYPPTLAALDGVRLPDHPSWRVTLPPDAVALERNARCMANCTAGYRHSTEAGECFILIVDDTSGTTDDGNARINVAVYVRRGRLRIGEINSAGNRYRHPAWMRSSLQQLLTRRWHNTATPDPEPPIRRAANPRARKHCQQRRRARR